MGHQVKERPRPADMKAEDPHRTRCHPVQPGMVRADQVWAWSLANPDQNVWRD
jgi:hypothetical protein